MHAQPAVPGFPATDIRALTQSPRTYGFHATLKAPFRLAQGVDERELLARVGDLAASHAPVAIPALRVERVDGFVALVPAGASRAVDGLAAQCVTKLDDLRAPLEATERARRLASKLTSRQRELLDLWGYPFVLEEFRFHMTLSERLDDARAARLLPWIGEWFAPALAKPSDAADIAVFMQPVSGADFLLRRRFPMTR